MSQAPLVVVVQYPQPERVYCPVCWGNPDPTIRVRGSFCDAAHLSKHLKKFHPGGSISYECSLCRYTGKTKYPQKDVIKHHEKMHSSRPSAPRPGSPRATTSSAASTAASSSESGARASTCSSTSAPRAGTSGARTRPPPASTTSGTVGAPSTTRGVSRSALAPSTSTTRTTGRLTLTRSTSTLSTRNTHTRPSASTRTRAPASTSPSAAPSSSPAVATPGATSSSEDTRPPIVPSYAAVTAAPAHGETSSRTTAGAARGAAIVGSAAHGAARYVIKENIYESHQQSARANEEARSPANSEARAPANSGSRSPANQSGCPLANVSGGFKDNTSAAADFLGFSGTEETCPPRVDEFSSRVAMLMAFYESPPDKRPDRAPPLPTSFHPGSGEGGSAPRGGRRLSPPLSAVHTPPSDISVAAGGAWGAGTARASTSLGRASTGSGPLPSPPGGTQTTTSYVTPGAAPTAAIFTPVSSPSAAITTATLVTTVVGSPIMSTGLPSVAGAQITPPARTPPAIGSPMVLRSARRVPRGATTSPPNIPRTTRGTRGATTSPPNLRTRGGPRGATTSPPNTRSRTRGATTSPPNTRRRLKGTSTSPLKRGVHRLQLKRPALPPPPPSPRGSNGDDGDDEEKRVDSSEEDSDSWTVARRRRGAPRSARRVVRGSSSEEQSSACSRAAASPPPITSANYPQLGGTTPRTTTRGDHEPRGEATGNPDGGTRPEAPVEVAAGQRAAQVGAEHPSAPVNVRGVMGRRGARASVLGRVGAAGATAARANVARGGSRPPVSRRNPVGAAGPPGGAPAAAAVVERRTPMQRATDRERLVALAESAQTLTDLEELAARVVSFVGEGGKGGRASRTRDRAGRSREAGGGVGGARAEGAGDDANANRRPAPAGPGENFLAGEGGRDRVREAARLQALFRKNRRKAIREVLSGPPEVCDLPTDRVQRYFEEVYSGAGNLHSGEPVELPEASSEDESAAALAEPITEREVDRRLRRMNNSAPGPDGHTYRDLRAADPHGRLLAAVFNSCLRLQAVPSSWKTSNTVLVFKKGERDRLENWRPLALGDTMPKLFAAVLADRLTDWAIANEKLSPAQKGFLRDEGCYEHNFVLQEILTDARRSRREAVVAWLDLSNAFGSVPHATIRRALVSAGVPASLIAIWGSMYDGCTTRVRTADGYTAPIIIRSGVRQGCPLSPIVFDLAIDSVLRAVSDVGPGLELLGSRWSVMAYADDLVLVSRTPTEMKRLLAVAEREAASVGLRFNPAKCATLHVGGGAGGRVLPTPFTIQGQTVRSMADGEAYEHLGIPTGSSVNQTPVNTLTTLTEDLRAVDRSLLAPWQKSEAVAVFLLPRMDFLLRGANVEKRYLKAVDLHVRKLAKSWMNLPQRASAEVVYIPPSRGGCGLLPMADLVDVLTIAHVFRLLTADDRAVKDLAWASLRGVVHRRIGRPPSCDDVASFLSGSLEGNLRGGGEASLWSRARNAARRQSDRCVIRWRWLEECEELVLECRGSRGRTVKIPPGARAQVIGRLRSAVAEYYTFTLLVKPDQGKVFEVSSRERVSNHFVRSGGFTRFADWRFVHRARLDVLPLNGARRWGDGDKRCRRCGAESETLPHVLCHCGPHSAAVQWRHDSVLLRLRRACRLPGDITVNQRVRGLEGELGELRPDLVVRHEPSKSVVICDVTVPFENRWAAFEEARERKIAKYSPMAEELRRLGYRVVVTAFVVGALGSWHPANEAVLRQLGIGRAYASMMRRLMVSDAIRWSRDIYVEHVSGIRQYEAPPRRADGGCPDVPIPLAIRRRVTRPRADGGDASVD